MIYFLVTSFLGNFYLDGGRQGCRGDLSFSYHFYNTQQHASVTSGHDNVWGFIPIDPSRNASAECPQTQLGSDVASLEMASDPIK